MGGHEAMTIIAGLGFRRDCAAADIVAVVRDAGARAGRPVDALAVPDFKADEAGIQQAVTTLGLPLHRIPRDALRGEQGRCLTRSHTARQATGLASVAEAAALAAAGRNGKLILPRIASATATCALAESV
jgi:cobalt-precorrin 5A hydrolase